MQEGRAMEMFREITYKGEDYISYTYIDGMGEVFTCTQRTLEQCRKLKEQFFETKKIKTDESTDNQ